MADVMLLRPRVDIGGEPPDNGDMEQRLAALEKAVADLPTKADFAELRSDVKISMADLRTDMHKNSVDIHRWMIATVIGLFLGFGGLFLAMSNALKQPPSAPATNAQSPIIINVPGATSQGPPPTR